MTDILAVLNGITVTPENITNEQLDDAIIEILDVNNGFRVQLNTMVVVVGALYNMSARDLLRRGDPDPREPLLRIKIRNRLYRFVRNGTIIQPVKGVATYRMPPVHDYL